MDDAAQGQDGVDQFMSDATVSYDLPERGTMYAVRSFLEVNTTGCSVRVTALGPVGEHRDDHCMIFLSESRPVLGELSTHHCCDTLCSPLLPLGGRLVGLLVKASASRPRAEDPGFDSRLRHGGEGGFLVESYQ